MECTESPAECLCAVAMCVCLPSSCPSVSQATASTVATAYLARHCPLCDVWLPQLASQELLLLFRIPAGIMMQAIPPGFLQELNMDMMEDLWFALAAAKDPEMLTASGAHSITDVFDRYLADVTWDDFWKAFPYELR